MTMDTQKKTALQALFESYCGNDSYRPIFNSPHEYDGKIYATDAYRLICCDIKDCDFEVKPLNGTPPKYTDVLPPSNMSGILNISEEMFDLYKTADELEYLGEDVECDECDGNGEVDWEYKGHTMEADCPECDGTGYSEQRSSRKTGRKSIGNQLVKLKDSYFKMSNIYRLLEAQKVLGGEIQIVHLSDKAGFKIGFCDILIMSIYVHRDSKGNPVLDDDVLEIDI